MNIFINSTFFEPFFGYRLLLSFVSSHEEGMKKQRKSKSAKLDWFTCNICGHEFNRAVDYLITNCAHIICNECLQSPNVVAGACPASIAKQAATV